MVESFGVQKPLKDEPSKADDEECNGEKQEVDILVQNLVEDLISHLK